MPEGIIVTRVYKIDGILTEITASGGSAKEALAIVIDAADELGAAPAGIPGAAAESAKPADKRVRRTKAEIEADEAKARAANTPPALPPTLPPMNQVFPPEGQPPLPFPAPGMAPTAPAVALSSAPPAPLGQHSVTLSAPPAPAAPPIMSLEEIARAELSSAITKLYGSVPQGWMPSVQGNVKSFLDANGGDVNAMTAAQAKAAEALVAGYQVTCDNAQKAA